MVIESMKMEFPVQAPAVGHVKLAISVEDQVLDGTVLMVLA